jgi:integrase
MENSMARPRESARVRQWRGKWYLIYTDYSRTPPCERRLSCDVLKARTAEARLALVKQYRTNEKLDGVEVVRRGGRLNYDCPLTEATAMFRKSVTSRVKTRQANASSRGGLSEAAGATLLFTLTSFETWLENEGLTKLTTGSLDGRVLGRFFDHLAEEKTKHGNREIFRSTATLNKHRRNLRTCLNFLADLRPPLFPDVAIFKKALKASPANHDGPSAFSTDELAAFFRTALDREEPGRKVKVLRLKAGQREQFEQTNVAAASTPVSRLFLLLALTGMRLGEALALRWEDVDLERGRVTIHAQKTGRTRLLPLIGAPEGEVAPGLLALLRQWRLQAGGSAFVLPHNGLPAPVFPKSAWQLTNDDSEVRRVGPQMLRQNFTSYAASIGIPAAVAALWQGHAANVAERYYRAQVLDRSAGASIQDAMGLAEFLPRIEAPAKAAASKRA